MLINSIRGCVFSSFYRYRNIEGEILTEITINDNDRDDLVLIKNHVEVA